MFTKSKISILFFIAMLVISACGSPAPEATQAPATEEVVATEAPATEVAEETSAYPVTIAHKYGETTITEKPERIVLVGLTEQDALLALGVVPVATREWYGEKPGAIFTWAEDKLNGAELPVVLPGAELNFEQIAGLNPDIIIGLYAGITQEEFDTLSKIAPVVAQPAEYADWGIPWQELTRTIGLIVGESARAEELITGVEEKFAAMREAHPEFQGATGVVASSWGYPDNYWVYGPEDSRGRFMTELGFVIPEEVNQLAVEQDSFGATVSLERLDLVDLDVTIWFAGNAEQSEAYRAEPIYQQLKLYSENRDIFLTDTDPIYDAFNFSSVLSLPFALDGLEEQLSLAVDGDPATVYTK
jgi:iron complex transport system substrate-binding protein